MAIGALEVNFVNLSLNQLPLLIQTQQDRLNRRKNNELLLVEDKPSTENKPIKPKPFKHKFNDRFKKNSGFQKS